MLIIARNMFILACLALAGMGWLLVFVADGPGAVGVIAGVPETTASEETVRLALMFDTLLPIGYGAGFVFFAVGLANDQRSYLLALTAVLFTLGGVTMDFVENGLAVSYAIQSEAPFIFATVGKYGLLGLAGVLISEMLSPQNRFAVPVFRYVAPIGLALLMSDIAGPYSVWFFVPILAFTFAFTAFIAQREASFQ